MGGVCCAEGHSATAAEFENKTAGRRRTEEEIEQTARAIVKPRGIKDPEEYQRQFGVQKRRLQEEDAKVEMADMGIHDKWLVEGFLEAFDQDANGVMDRHELDHMLEHLRKVYSSKDEIHKDDDTPADLKATMALNDNGMGPYTSPGNPRLKMLLTSAGIMPGTEPTKMEAYRRLKRFTPGKGILYLIDARMSKLQWHSLADHHDPEKTRSWAGVPYRRVPDELGGTPVKENGELLMKNEEELANTGDYGYAGVPYMMRHRDHYSNGNLKLMTGDKEGTPIYVSYLWYTGEVDEDGNFKHDILLAKGVYKGGRFVALHHDGSEFSEEDYLKPRGYDSQGDDWLKIVDGETFANVLDEVQVVFGCGGSPYMCILHFQPMFIDETGTHVSKRNPYGGALVDALSSGKVVYVSMSAGSMCWNWTMGPITTSREKFMLNAVDKPGDDDDVVVKVDLSRKGELRRLWLFPRLGKKIGMPHDISAKVHVYFDPETVSYDGTGDKCAKASKVVSAIEQQTKYCVLLADYDWAEGSGDALEISGGKTFFHAGYAKGMKPVSEKGRSRLKAAGHTVDETLPLQPEGVPPEGIKFEWVPEHGEVICAGPKAKTVFRMYAGKTGPLKDAHPAYPRELGTKERGSKDELQAA